MTTASIHILASIRCSKTFEVTSDLLKPGNEKKLALHVVALVDADGEPSGWIPEHFGDETDIHLPDQDIEIVRDEGNVSEILHEGDPI